MRHVPGSSEASSLQIVSPARPAPESPQDLLAYWLKLSTRQRKKEFADISHVAESCGVARRTVQQWLERGYLKAFRLSHKHQIWLPSVQQYLEQGLPEPEPGRAHLKRVAQKKSQ